MRAAPILVWFRQDLRLGDNPALSDAARSGRPVVPVFVLDDDTPGDWRPGGASRWWLHHSLASLGRSLAAAGSPLVLRRGRADIVIGSLLRETGAGTVLWNRCYEPWAMERDGQMKADLRAAGVEARSFNGSLLREPMTVRTAAGEPYRVFTPFWRAVSSSPDWPEPLAAPDRLMPPETAPASDALESWGLLPTTPDWAGGLRQAWQPGEAAATARLRAFLDGAAADYADGRDRPGSDGTSRLSPHLHFGEISPRQVWAATRDAMLSGNRPEHRRHAESFLRELGWREFCYNLLYHFPKLPERPLNPRFEDFPWQPDSAALDSWRRGRTGYPIVDAGMRQLWTTGWMHNRVRMIVGSFLVKHLLLPWQEGQRWFWDTLVDADLANNAAGWQWIAGCGADAAPYFRVFNPVLQGGKFDPDGRYVRRWVPELAALPDRLIHQPWTATAETLRRAGIRLGTDYPLPCIDHKRGRDRALAAFATLRQAGDAAAPDAADPDAAAP
ncbi:cryptochrome/photolyase family protein [Rhodocista pekingensis]|uniref:Cryptochrome/photolyase family protein n=1 Tax=Rhodocista pekingensis TaxID=201185 RepID=A0ABW2KTZ3_9PROT